MSLQRKNFWICDHLLGESHKKGLKEIKRTRYVLLIALALENPSDLRAGVLWVLL